MKKLFLTALLITCSSVIFAQNGYKKVYKYNDYNTNWALVKTISNTYGFIDREGNTVVQPVYAKIEHFDYENGSLALVQNISGAYGFMDREGNEVIKAMYWTKEEAFQQIKLLNK